MNRKLFQTQSRVIVLGGLGVSLLIAMFLSPLASQNPDGLDRVATDLKFNTQVAQAPPAHKLPFATVFDEYALRGVPQPLATPLAGLLGTLMTFGLAWGMGKVLIRKSSQGMDSSPTESQSDP